MTEELSLRHLPLAKRVAKYRELEQLALREAKRAIGPGAEAFTALAKAWARLAESTEQRIAKRVTEVPEAEVDQKQAALKSPGEPSDPES